MPKISVLTAVYIDSEDKLQWFRETLQSVKNQSFTDFEHIIVDDYSPVSLEELQLTTMTDNRFRWFKAHGNQGPAACRNTAAALAESDAIIVLDADDLLGNDITLETMYNIWQEDRKRVVYGNLQMLVKSNDNYTRGKVISLGEYTFENSLNLEGLFPVTALHSIECHQKIGGWSTELDAGLEDVEYWISAGEHGYCGRKVNHTTLLYRKHNTSRAWTLRHGIDNNPSRENEMQRKIISLHQPTFEGNWPMGCCGGNKKTTSNGTLKISAKVTTLDDIKDEDKIWIIYVGPRTARFRVAGRHSSVKEYIVQGKDHWFQIHINDKPMFESLGRGKEYIFPNRPPDEISQPEPEQPLPQREPQMAVIEHLDRVAAQTREIEIVEQPLPQVELEEIPLPSVVPIPDKQEEVIISGGFVPSGMTLVPKGENIIPAETYDLSTLDLPQSILTQLQAENWSLQKLAQADYTELLPYKGIGQKRAEDIINKAKQYT